MVQKAAEKNIGQRVRLDVPAYLACLAITSPSAMLGGLEESEAICCLIQPETSSSACSSASLLSKILIAITLLHRLEHDPG
jgi:hypothetical protein